MGLEQVGVEMRKRKRKRRRKGEGEGKGKSKKENKCERCVLLKDPYQSFAGLSSWPMFYYHIAILPRLIQKLITCST